ncbi:MAG: acyl carrier protein [Desulfobacterales bacterium]|jgi:acyl carrier protein
MQEQETILEEIYTVLQPFVPQGLAIDEETDMVADLGLDSLKVMKIVESIEDRLDISIPLNILPEVRTVKDFAQQIQKLIGD